MINIRKIVSSKGADVFFSGILQKVEATLPKSLMELSVASLLMHLEFNRRSVYVSQTCPDRRSTQIPLVCSANDLHM